MSSPSSAPSSTATGRAVTSSPTTPSSSSEEQDRAGRRDVGPHVILSPIELRPHPFQERLLELIELSRRRGHHRNLLVAATGTGKTVMAALDYARLRKRLSRSRLLFVAHREEILDQSLATFRHALRDAVVRREVGRWRATRAVRARLRLDPEPQQRRPRGTSRPIISTSSSSTSSTTPPPPRTGGCSTTSGRSSCSGSPPPRSGATASRSCTGSTTASPPSCGSGTRSTSSGWPPSRTSASTTASTCADVPWRRGRGYDVDALSAVYTSHDVWARQVVQQVAEHAEPESMRCLGFCVSIDHARFMARHFARHGIDAVAIWGDSPASRARGRASRPRRGPGSGRVLGGPVQRGRRRAAGRHRAHAPPDREPHALPPAARPRPAQDARQAVLHRARLRGDPSSRVPLRPALAGPARRHRGERSSGRSSASFRSSLPAATCSSTRRPPRSCSGASARRSRRDGRPRSTSCARFAAIVPTSTWPASSRRRTSISMTSTTAARAGRI